MSRYLAILILCLYIWGCSPYSDDTIPNSIDRLENLQIYSAHVEPTYKVQFEREQNFGSSKDTFVLVGGSSRNLARVDGDGRVFIPDRQQNTIHVFAPDGRYATHIGREGKGPGEFLIIDSINIGQNRLYVSDSKLRRINVFSLDSLTFIHSINLNNKLQKGDQSERLSTMIPSTNFFVDNDGNLLIQFMSFLPNDIETDGDSETREKEQNIFYWINQNGEIISDQILSQSSKKNITETFRGVSLEITLPVYEKPLIAVSNEGSIYAAQSGEFLIREYDENGSYSQSFYYPYEKSPLNRDDLVKRYDHGYDSPVLQAARTVNLPESWPALHSMLVDDENRLWISTIVDAQEVYQWWILDAANGQLLAQFRWPRSQTIQQIKDGKLYARETDENGLEEIVCYNIKINEKE